MFNTEYWIIILFTFVKLKKKELSAFDHIMFKVKLQNAKSIQNIPLRLEDVVSSNEKYKIYEMFNT